MVEVAIVETSGGSHRADSVAAGLAEMAPIVDIGAGPGVSDFDDEEVTGRIRVDVVDLIRASAGCSEGILEGGRSALPLITIGHKLGCGSGK